MDNARDVGTQQNSQRADFGPSQLCFNPRPSATRQPCSDFIEFAEHGKCEDLAKPLGRCRSVWKILDGDGDTHIAKTEE